MRWHLMREIEERGAEAVIDDAIAEALDGPDAIYLSIDIDVLDPGMAPGTGTPEPGGMLTRELLRAVRRIVGSVELAAMDVVEVSPPYDHAEITAVAAHRCVLEAISALAVKKRDGRPVRHEPRVPVAVPAVGAQHPSRSGRLAEGRRTPMIPDADQRAATPRQRPRPLLRPRCRRRSRTTSPCTWRSPQHRTGRSSSSHAAAAGLPCRSPRPATTSSAWIWIRDMLDRARARWHRPTSSRRPGGSLELVDNRTCSDLGLDERFDLVILAFNSLLVLAGSGRRSEAAIQAMAEHLVAGRPGGAWTCGCRRPMTSRCTTAG